MNDTDRKEKLLRIISDGIAILAGKPEYSNLLTLCRQLKAQVASGRKALPGIKDLQDFFEQDIFLNYEMKIIKPRIIKAGFAGLKIDRFHELLPEFASARTPSILTEKLKGDRRFLVENGIAFYNCPSLSEVLDQDKEKAALLRTSIEGKTQKSSPEEKTAVRNAVAELKNKYYFFREDRFVPFYSHYGQANDVLNNELHINDVTKWWLSLKSRTEARNLEKALQDKEVPDDVKAAVARYIKANGIPVSTPRNAQSRSSAALNGAVAESAIHTSMDKKTFKRVYARLIKKIEKNFDKKFFIGDIAISDQEYEILCEVLKNKCVSIIQSRTALTDCPIFAVALVQIGIRKYNGAYWTHVSKVADMKLQGPEQGMIGQSFINTLKNHGKYVQSETERVASILFHTFVSNYYSKGLFEILFQYYRNDLERDINRNDAEQMRALMDTFAIKSQLSEEEGEAFTDQFMEKGSKAYKLRQHTLQAISATPIHSSIRLRRFIRLIDKAFWKDSVPKNPTSRLTILFKEWVTESEVFCHEYQEYKMGTIRNRGKKHFSTPYLFADVSRSEFSLKLPAQIVREKYANGLYWLIRTAEGTHTLLTEIYPVLTGFKTENMELPITKKEAFGSISCELVCKGEQVRRFGELEKNPVRFFDMEGDYAPRLFHIPMCAYTMPDAELKSPALLDHFFTNGMIRWDFEFNDGDIAFLPDGKNLIVGERYQEGFTPRGRLKNCVCRDGAVGSIEVYSVLPNMILTVPTGKIPGTEITVNGTRHRLGDCETIEFEFRDARGTKAFYVETSQFGEIRNKAVNTIILDIPGFGVARTYRFAWIDGLTVNFDGDPYVFDEKGCIKFPDSFSLACEHLEIEKLHEENGFIFPIRPELTEIAVHIDEVITVYCAIPALMWSRDGENWHTEPIGEVWRTDFFSSNRLFLRSPAKVELSTDEDAGEDDDEYDSRSVTAESAGDRCFVVDLTRFKSWITRDKLRYPVNILVGNTLKVLAHVYAKSYAVGCELSADYDEGILTCSYDIISSTDCYADIVHLDSGKIIVSKRRLTGGAFTVKADLSSGKYRLELFETEEMDDGFDDPEYLSFHTYETSLINKNDFTGNSLRVQRFRAINGPEYYEHIVGVVYMDNLKKTGPMEYEGILSIRGKISEERTHVKFSKNEENRGFHLFYLDSDGGKSPLYYKYDCRERHLIQKESDIGSEAADMSEDEKLRRFKILDDAYLFYGKLEGVISTPLVPAVDEPRVGTLNLEKARHNPLSLTIEEMGLTLKTYDVLKKVGLLKMFDIHSCTEKEFCRKVENRRRVIEEIKGILDVINRDFRKEW